MLKKLAALIGSNRRTSALLLVFCIAVACVIIFRIDRVPGIISGYLATIVLAVILTYNWRKISMFVILLAGCAAGFFLLSYLHEVVYDPAVITGGVVGWQRFLMWLFHMSISIIVAFFCPVGFSVGVVGCVRLWLTRGGEGDAVMT